MIYQETEVDGVWIVDIEPRGDERGLFARTFDADEFRERGMSPDIVQCNLSFNHERGTLRGLHLQTAPHPEAKLVRCSRGSIVDVAVDVRPDSPSYGRHVMVELTAENRRALYLPPYVAHGYQTLEEATEVVYQVSGAYAPGAEQGYRYDDPAFGIAWPLPVATISPKDAAWPLVDGPVAKPSAGGLMPRLEVRSPPRC